MSVRREVEEFLYHEARLLDSWELHQWLELLTDDVRYRVPIRETVAGGDDVAGEDVIAVAHIDEDRQGLANRVARYDTGSAHAEIPQSRVRHFVSNVEILEEAGDELTVGSNLLLFQGRRDGSDHLLSARRLDVLRRHDGGFRLARRTVILDHTLLPRALSVLL